jgi:V/A-type H+-transporting ATPase subunit C
MAGWVKVRRAPGQDTRYAFAVGRIRALEARLLDSTRIERLLDTDDADEAWRTLADSDYGALTAELSGPTAFESLLEAQEDRLWHLFEELCLDDWVREIMLSRLDYSNLKVLARLRLVLRNDDPWEARTGSVPLEQLSEALTEHNISRLPPHLASAAQALFDLESAGKLNPRHIDLDIDDAFFAFLIGKAREFGTSFFVDFVRIWIDLTNIATLFRVRQFKPDPEVARRAFHRGGIVPASHFSEALDEAPEVLPQRFFATPYYALIEHGGIVLGASGSFSRLEKLLDDYLIDFIRRTKVYAFGAEPLVAYLLAKEHEIKMLRMIFTGKVIHIPTSALRERMPRVY